MNDVRHPGEGRYAQVEREQRWVVGTPPDLDGPPIEILDHYVNNTRLRVRRAERGSCLAFKLGQKVRVDPDDPEIVKLTNIYLDEREYTALMQMEGAQLAKNRWRVDVHGSTVVVDVFGGSLEGLVLAETELPMDAEPVPAPPFALVDVTHDDRFSGGALASLCPSGQKDLVAAVRSER